MEAALNARKGYKMGEKTQSPLYLPDLPLPTPPPMANIMVTSRFDLQTRGGCGYRRILSSRSTDFGRSPILGRSRAFGSMSENLGNSPMPRHRNFNDLKTEENSPLPRHRHFNDLKTEENSPLPRHKHFNDLKTDENSPLPHHRNSNALKSEEGNAASRYLSKDSILSHELEEVNYLAHELQNKFGELPLSNEVSPDYQNSFLNEHYMSDIDENEEIKQFSYGYKTPERRLSDSIERNLQTFGRYPSYNTLPSLSSLKHYGSLYGSFSSMKSSDFCSPSNGKRVEVGDQPAKVIKPPQRPIVKIAKIR